MTPQQREEYVEAVMLNWLGPASIDDAERIVDQVIRPALAFAWREGQRASTSINPYEIATPQEVEKVDLVAALRASVEAAKRRRLEAAERDQR